MKKLFLFTDGGARGNPGPAGAGVILVDQEKKVLDRFSSYIGETTNNKAEYLALILGLIRAKKVNDPAETQLVIHLDSELVVKQLTGLYRIKDRDLQVLAHKVMRRTNDFAKVDYKYIERAKNKLADKLVNMAIDTYEELTKDQITK